MCVVFKQNGWALKESDNYRGTTSYMRTALMRLWRPVRSNWDVGTDHSKDDKVQMIATSDALYEWYSIAYFPHRNGSTRWLCLPPILLPGKFHQSSIQLSAVYRHKETVHWKIAQYESSLEEMAEKLGKQDQVAREIDLLEVIACKGYGLLQPHSLFSIFIYQ
jgi:hypothetical protein